MPDRRQPGRRSRVAGDVRRMPPTSRLGPHPARRAESGEWQASSSRRRTRSDRSAIPRSALRGAVRQGALPGGRPGEGRFFGLVRNVSPILRVRARPPWNAAGLRGSAPLRRRDGFRCLVPSTDSSDRAHISKGQEQCSRRRAGRRRQSLGHWIRRGRTYEHRSKAGNAGRSRPADRESQGAWNRDRARPGFPVLARSPLCAATSGMVSQTSGRHDSVCGESAEEISGYFPSRF